MDGKTKIQVDKNTLNILLQEFASKDDTKVSFEGGAFVVDKGPIEMKLTELPLSNTKLQVKKGGRTVKVEIADFRLENEHLSLDIDLGFA